MQNTYGTDDLKVPYAAQTKEKKSQYQIEKTLLSEFTDKNNTKKLPELQRIF